MPKKDNFPEVVGQKSVDLLYSRITARIDSARQSIQRSVNVEMIKAYWYIGRDIVEEEQSGKYRAEYGKGVLKQLSSKLQEKYKRGFGVDTLTHARKFYTIYQWVSVSGEKSDAARPKLQEPEFNNNLSWTHYRALMRVKREEARMFYGKRSSNTLLVIKGARKADWK